jgi:hypothetical protein
MDKVVGKLSAKGDKILPLPESAFSPLLVRKSNTSETLKLAEDMLSDSAPWNEGARLKLDKCHTHGTTVFAFLANEGGYNGVDFCLKCMRKVTNFVGKHHLEKAIERRLAAVKRTYVWKT